MGQLIKGKAVADAIASEVKNKAEELRQNGISPKLKIVRLGQREDDLAYERAAIKRMASCSIDCEVLSLSRDISQEDFIKELEKVDKDETVHGVLIFRPLPKQIDENAVKYVIRPEKDVDCFNPINVAKVMEGDDTGFPPCTPAAAIEMLKFYNIEMKGKNAVVAGRSMVVGKPAAILLLKENATVTICHSKTADLKSVVGKADILIAAIGKSKMITGDFIKEGAAVIDVGINVDSQGNITGDVDTEDCIGKASVITPVPAGVGSVTTAVLAKHVLRACNQLTGK